MINNSNQDLIHCDKCHKLIEPHNQSSIKVLCNRCDNLWVKFFDANYRKIEDEFKYDKRSQPNPTWYVFIGVLKSKTNSPIEPFIFR